VVSLRRPHLARQDVMVAVANPARVYFDQDLAVLDVQHRDFLDLQRLVDTGHDGGLERLWERRSHGEKTVAAIDDWRV